MPLTEPTSAVKPQASARRLAPPALVTLLAIAIAAANEKLFTDSDTGHYLSLAAGIQVPEPYAARQLAPLIVRGLTHLDLSLHQGFWVLGIASLTFFVATTAYLLEQSKAPTWLRWSILGLYFWPLAFSGLVLPDLFYAALLSGFLLLVWHRRLGWACAMLLPLMVARESTILVLLCWLIVAWRTLTWSKRLGSLASVGAGAAIVHFLTHSSAGNREGLPPALYLLGKIPWNFAKNFLGIDAWADINQACGVPAWHHALHLGPLHDIGYCSLQPEYPIRTLAYALATFGLLPLLLWQVSKAPRKELLVRFSLVYGLTAYATAGLLGYSVQRLYGYGWPAFLVAIPFLLGTSGFRTSRYAAGFVALHFASSWLEWRVDKLPLLLGEIVLWSAGFLIMGYGWRSEPSPPKRLGNTRKML